MNIGFSGWASPTTRPSMANVASDEGGTEDARARERLGDHSPATPLSGYSTASISGHHSTSNLGRRKHHPAIGAPHVAPIATPASTLPVPPIPAARPITSCFADMNEFFSSVGATQSAPTTPRGYCASLYDISQPGDTSNSSGEDVSDWESSTRPFMKLQAITL